MSLRLGDLSQKESQVSFEERKDTNRNTPINPLSRPPYGNGRFSDVRRGKFLKKEAAPDDHPTLEAR